MFENKEDVKRSQGVKINTKCLKTSRDYDTNLPIFLPPLLFRVFET